MVQDPTDPLGAIAEEIVLPDTVGGIREEGVTCPATSGRHRLDTYTALVTHT